MTRPLRLGVAGAGRVFERLYRPALERVPDIELVAVCDLQPPGAGLPDGTVFFGGLEEMVAAGGLDAVAVLTPPRLHAEQAGLVLTAGLRVLVEKPVAMNLAELRGVLEAGGDLTPAFPRRYWPAYRGLSRAVRRIELETNPGEWGARSAGSEHPAFDLLPHLVDLACVAKGSSPAAVAGSKTDSVADATLRFGDGSTVRCRAIHGSRYGEWFAEGKAPERVGPPGFVASLKQRARRALPVDVEGMAALLAAWARSDGTAPGPEDAWNSVAVVEAFRRSVESGREETVEEWPGEVSREGGVRQEGR